MTGPTAVVRLAPVAARHTCGDESRPALLWRFDRPVRAVSTAAYGGGLGERRWVMNAEVPLSYARTDVDAHVRELAGELGCDGPGVALLTAAPVREWTGAADGGVEVVVTVGLTKPTWAADADDALTAWQPGTVNVVAWVPARLTDAALVNAVATITEAKTQALVEAGVPGTGTASDAVCVCCPAGGPAEAFGGPRSRWGAPLARAVHRAVAEGAVRWLARAGRGAWEDGQATPADFCALVPPMTRKSAEKSEGGRHG